MARVMIVDDTSFMRKILKDIFKKTGHSVVAEAENGRKAIKTYRSLELDLVTIDIIMPEMDGLETIKKIKSKDNDIKIIIVSAMGQKEIIFKAMDIGVDDFIVKPFKEERIKEAIEKTLSDSGS